MPRKRTYRGRRRRPGQSIFSAKRGLPLSIKVARLYGMYRGVARKQK